MTEYEVQVYSHKTSDLLMASIREIPGFIVHAYSIDELEGKLAREFAAFMNATDRPVHDVQVIRADPPPGFWPPTFIAKASLDRVAA